MKRYYVVLGLLLPLGVALGLAYLARPAPRINVILVTIDTLCADHLGAYGYDRKTSPNIDAFAATAVAFDRAFAQATLSGPSHASIMTSLEVPLHGVMSNGLPCPDSNLTLAEVLHGAGYQTAMFVSDDLVSAKLGFDQGFDVAEVHQVPNHAASHHHKDRYVDREPPTAVFDATLDWLSQPTMNPAAVALPASSGKSAKLRPRSTDKPFFLWLHALHPHESYEPPAPYDTMFMEEPKSLFELRCSYTLDLVEDGNIDLTPADRAFTVALYDGEIAYVDTQLERLFSWLRQSGIADNTIVVITADHGEMLLTHPTRTLSGHGRHRYDAVMRVPLIVKAPGAKAGHRVSNMVGSMDIAPTILELAGIHPPTQWRGKSLVHDIKGGDDVLREAMFSLTTHSDDVLRTAVRTLNRKLIIDSTEHEQRKLLFDLDTDPLETINVARESSYAADLERLSTLHDQWLAEVKSEHPVNSGNPAEDVREMLRRGGYLRDKQKNK